MKENFTLFFCLTCKDISQRMRRLWADKGGKEKKRRVIVPVSELLSCWTIAAPKRKSHFLRVGFFGSSSEISSFEIPSSEMKNIKIQISNLCQDHIYKFIWNSNSWK